MAIKRKRSWDSPRAAPFSIFSSPSNDKSAAGGSSDGSASPFSSYQCHPRSFPSIARHDSHLCSRTFKRHRDSRPSDATIHSHTMQKLFAGARQRQLRPTSLNDRPYLPSDRTSTPMHTQSELEAHAVNSRTNLHAFWNLPNSPDLQQHIFRSSSESTTDSTNQRCDDCDDLLEEDPSVGTLSPQAYIDTFESPWACDACGKAVCRKCAADRGINDRLCLECVLR